MSDLAWIVTPVAVLLVLLLFRFVGCNQILGIDQAALDPYPGINPYGQAILKDDPVAFWQLQEKNPPTDPNGGNAKDATGNHGGSYGMVVSPYQEDVQHLSPPVSVVTLNLGVTPPLQKVDMTSTCVEMDGGFVRAVYAAELNAPAFTIEALVLPQWDLVSPLAQGRYRCVMESTNNPPPNGQKNSGYALYAGPEDPLQLNTPYRWQLWVGDGTIFRRLAQLDPTAPGTLVTAEPTYLAATFDGSEFNLYVYTESSDLTFVRTELVPQTYVRNPNGDFTMGITGPTRALVPPFPGPQRRLYPFHGRMEEVAVYNKHLTADQIMAHCVAAFHLP
jgi:hypothetical protein